MSKQVKRLRSPLIWLGIAVIYALPFFALDGSGAAFIKIGDIKGESTTKGHVDEIDVLSWSWGATASPPSAGGGAQTTRATFRDFTFSHNYDLASPILALRCFTGASINEVRFTATTGGATPLEYLVITFSDVIVTAVSQNGDAASDRPLEDVSFAYKTIKFQYENSAGKKSEASWDLEANK